MLSTKSKYNNLEEFTYCPECGKVLEVKESDDINSTKLCGKCLRKYRPRF